MTTGCSSSCARTVRRSRRDRPRWWTSWSDGRLGRDSCRPLLHERRVRSPSQRCSQSACLLSPHRKGARDTRVHLHECRLAITQAPNTTNPRIIHLTPPPFKALRHRRLGKVHTKGAHIQSIEEGGEALAEACQTLVHELQVHEVCFEVSHAVSELGEERLEGVESCG